MSVYLVRHATSLFNEASDEQKALAAATLSTASASSAAASSAMDVLRDADLSAEGELQIAELRRDALRLFPGARLVYASPLRRTWRTALAIAAGLGDDVPVRASPILREVRRDVSDLGTANSWTANLSAEWWLTPSCTSCALLHECVDCVATRAMLAELMISSALRQPNAPSIVYVSHSDFLLELTGRSLDTAESFTWTPPRLERRAIAIAANATATAASAVPDQTQDMAASKAAAGTSPQPDNP